MTTPLDQRPTPPTPGLATPRPAQQSVRPGMSMVQVRATLETAAAGVTANKVRTILTLLGIMISVAAVVTAIGIGNGSQAAVNARLSSLGTNLLTVQPGATSSRGIRGGIGSATTLTLSDAQTLASEANPNGALPDVSLVAPEDTTTVQAVAGSNNTSTTADGVTPEILVARDFQVAAGRFITAQDIQTSAQVCDLGATAATTLFPNGATDAIGSNILLNGQAYQVIGIMATKGGGNTDSDIFVPLTAVENRLSLRSGAANAVSAINAVATQQDTTDAAQAEITTLLRSLHKLAPNAQSDFSFFSQTAIQQTASSVDSALTVLLGAISAVSLLVGGIGIMNIMLVTVTERTREIGLRKAVGARRSDILAQFLTESTLISVLGGVLGVGLSYGVVWLYPRLESSASPPIISEGSIVLAVSVSLLIGLFFGSYPASRAAALDPIQALRYE